MIIKNIEAWPVELPLAEPYTIAYESVDKCENVFLFYITLFMFSVGIYMKCEASAKMVMF